MAENANSSCQVDAIVSYIIVQLANKNDGWSSPLGITTENQLWDHIDHSLEQAKAGNGRDADEVMSIRELSPDSRASLRSTAPV